jgi:hypothetical protein
MEEPRSSKIQKGNKQEPQQGGPGPGAATLSGLDDGGSDT